MSQKPAAELPFIVMIISPLALKIIPSQYGESILKTCRKFLHTPIKESQILSNYLFQQMF